MRPLFDICVDIKAGESRRAEVAALRDSTLEKILPGLQQIKDLNLRLEELGDQLRGLHVEHVEALEEIGRKQRRDDARFNEDPLEEDHRRDNGKSNGKAKSRVTPTNGKSVSLEQVTASGTKVKIRLGRSQIELLRVFLAGPKRYRELKAAFPSNVNLNRDLTKLRERYKLLMRDGDTFYLTDQGKAVPELQS